MADTFTVGDGLKVSSTVVRRACARAALDCPGVVGLQPGMSSIAQGMLRRAGEMLTGRAAAGPLDGVEITTDEQGSPLVLLTVAVAGRPAKEVAIELADGLAERVWQLTGARPTQVRVRVSDIVPIGAEAPDADTAHTGNL